MLAAVPADHKRLRNLLEQTGYIPNKADKNWHSEARRRQKQLHVEARARRKQRRNEKEASRQANELRLARRSRAYQFYFLEFAADKELGLDLEMLAGEVVVGNVKPDKQAAKFGVRAGMVLLSVNGMDVDNESLGTLRTAAASCALHAVLTSNVWIPCGLQVEHLHSFKPRGKRR